MKVTEVKFGKKFNIGNYESEEYVITAIVEEDESAADVFKTLKVEVMSAHSGAAVAETETEDEGEDEDVQDKPAGKSGKGKSKSAANDEGTVEEEVVDEEIEGEDEAEADDETEEEEVEDEGNDESEDEGKNKKPNKKSPSSTAGAKAGKAEGKSTGKSKFKPKAQVYQRGNETHKEIFSGILKAVAPLWKKDDKSKAKAKAASQKLEGTEFLDVDGNVIESFKQSLKKMMAVKK